MPVVPNYQTIKVKCVYANEAKFNKKAKYERLTEAVSSLNKNGYVIVDIT